MIHPGYKSRIIFLLFLFLFSHCYSQDKESGKIFRNKGTAGYSNAIIFHPGGKIIVSAGPDSLILWDVDTCKPIKNIKVDNMNNLHLYSLLFSPDGKILASKWNNETIMLWNMDTGNLIYTFKHYDLIEDMEFSPDGKILASLTITSINLWKLDTGKRLYEIKPLDSFRNLAFSPDGNFIAAANMHILHVWEINTGKLINKMSNYGYTDTLKIITYSPDGKIILCFYSNGIIKRWEASTGKLLDTVSLPYRDIFFITFSPDRTIIACSTIKNQNEIKIIDANTRSPMHTLRGHISRIGSIVFSPDSKTMVSTDNNGTINLWETSTGKLINTCTGHPGNIECLAFSPDGKAIASASWGMIKLWKSETGELIHTLIDPYHDVTTILAVTFSPDGNTILSAHEDKTIKLWQAGPGKLLKTLKCDTHAIMCAAFSPDRKTIAFGCGEKTVQLWEIETGTLLHTSEGHNNRVISLAFSPEGRILASGGWDEKIRLWNTKNGKLFHSLVDPAGSDRVLSMVFNPDGKILASGDCDYSIRLWEISTGKCMTKLKAAGEDIETLAFSPDGKILASGSRESTFIELWDTKTGNRVKKLIGHNDSIKTLAFSPDGKALASGGYDNDIIVWRTPVKAVSITASSYIDYKNMYTPAAVFDENPGTGWLEAQDGPGIGEKVMLELNEEIKVDEIMVMPGYFDPGWWASNNRVKKLKMITGDKEMVGEFTNEMKAQIMQLPGEVCFKKVIFEIVDIFASGKDNDTGISEIFFYYKGERVEIIL